MRILQVVPAYFPAVRYGGPIRSVHGLAVALRGRGHLVEVATTSVDGDDDLRVPTDRPVDLDGIPVHYFRVPALRRLCWSPDLDRFLRHQVAAFDIVHLHSVFLLPTRSAARAARAAGVPYIASPRGMLMRDAIRGRSRLVKRAWIRLVERTTYRHAAAVHVTAPLEAAELADAGISATSVSVIPNGFSWPGDYAPLADGPFAALPERYALFLGRINWKKGLDRLIRAWRHVPDLPLIVAGNDEDGYQTQMQALARSTGVADRVRFVGPASDDDKWALYAAASVFVLPSYAENFGNVVIEAMAMKCPVVLSEAVGAAALAREAGAGLANSGEPAEFARDVRAIVADPARARDMGLRGCAYVRAHLGWASVAASMERTYLDSLRSAPGRGDV